MRYSIIFGAVLLLAAACSAKPRYYKSVGEHPFSLETAQIGVDVFVENPKTSPKRNAFNLSERGQAAFIERGPEDIKQLRAALADPISPTPKSKSVDRQFVSFSRTLTFSVIARNLAPADRVTAADVTARLAEDGWEFTGWRGFKQVESDIKVAQVVRSLNTEFSGEGGLSFPGVKQLGDLGFAGAVSSETQTTQDLQFNVVEFLPQLKDREAIFYLSAPFPQVNLAGVYQVTVDFRIDDDKFVDEAAFLHFSLLEGKESVGPVYTPYVRETHSADGVNLLIDMPYTLRHVKRNGRTIGERDDKVDYLRRPKEITNEQDACEETVYSQTPDGVLVVGAAAGNSGLIRVTDCGAPAISRAMIHPDELQVDAFMVVVVKNGSATPLRLFIPNLNIVSANAYCAASANLDELQQFFEWIRKNPNDRRRLIRDQHVIYEAYVDGVPATAADIRSTRIARYPVNYEPRHGHNEIPESCPNL